MSRIVFELATPSDDAALRRLLAEIPMGGGIRVAFEREPSYFHAVGVQGHFAQVVVARDTATGALAGVGTRSVSPRFVNGEVRQVGYLSDLRLAPAYRGGTLVARGYRLLRELHRDGRADLYYTVIAADNETALRTIAARRAGLPPYRDLGLLLSPAVNLVRRRRALPADVEIVRGHRRLLPDIVACLNRNGQRRQFGPAYAVEDFDPACAWLRGFRVEDFYAALRGSRVVGVLARWDQNPFKQTRVLGYGGALRLLRPLYNLAAPVLGAPRFPAPGARLRAFYVAFVAIDGDDLAVFRALLRRLYNEAVESGYGYCLIGLHEGDPLAAALSDYRLSPFRGRLFCVHFEDGEAAYRRLDGRPPHVELAFL